MRREPIALLCLLVACGEQVASPPDEDDATTGSATSAESSSAPGQTDPNPTTEDSSTSTGEDPTTMPAEESSSTGTPECGNDVQEGLEECDGTDLGGEDCQSQGFEAGELLCNADCHWDHGECYFAACGNEVLESSEMCDGMDLDGQTCQTQGFDSGTLLCGQYCSSFDTSGCGMCGSGAIDGDEICDGNLLGGEDCLSQGFDNGTLACVADCMALDLSLCGTCGDNILDPEEACETDLGGQTCLTLGFDSGTLACAQDCTVFNTTGCGMCGNGVTDGDEVCDGTDVGTDTCVSQGFDNGHLTCLADCSGFDVSVCGTCGDGIIDPAENCDTDQLGGETCASLGLSGGDLACSTSCQYDIAACDIPGFNFGEDTGYIGYYFEPPSLPCDDISATGTPAGLFDDDSIEVDIGFTFPFYDIDFDLVTIESNGVLHFGSADYHGFGNECLPTNYFPSDTNIYVLWDDLNPDGVDDEIYYETLGSAGDQRFVVQWDTNFYSNAFDDPIRIQAMLSEATGQITICYVEMESAMAAGENGASGTVGIQEGPANGFDYSCNTADVTSGLQIFYVPI